MESITVRKHKPDDLVIALAGNPNVGKSTLFNALTGLHQHTGNWPGKTVSHAQGYCTAEGRGVVLVDLPGCYSLLSHSAEEECARDFLRCGGADCVVVVCDATALERNLNLVLQTMELAPNTILCVNLMDEARKKGIEVNLWKLRCQLKIPVVGTEARSGKGLSTLLHCMVEQSAKAVHPTVPPVHYAPPVEEAATLLQFQLERVSISPAQSRYYALRLLDGTETIAKILPVAVAPSVQTALQAAKSELLNAGLEERAASDSIARSLVQRAEELTRLAVTVQKNGHSQSDRRLDRLFTGRVTGPAILLLLLLGIFWLTVSGANVPSAWLSAVFARAGTLLRQGLTAAGLPAWVISLCMDGVYQTVSWVVSVMLPPMAIFFPLFTLLEDFGYLPRAAFNADHCFQWCGACGKQALTTAMGFGCNAVGVTGARIIDSPRERLLAVVTNSFVPCNGRLPMLVTLISLFFAASGQSGLLSAAALLCLILLSIALTLFVSRLLSHTLLRGQPSSFVLELPPYRRPQVGKVLVRSLLDRTLFVLGRAVAVAAPAGALLWVLAHCALGEQTLLAHCAAALDPFARFFGLDGVIFLAFLLGWPANEIVLPIMLMTYLAQGTLVQTTDLAAMQQLFVQHGWTSATVLCTTLFALLHWPCSTTCVTIYKETKSLKWTILSVLLPITCGLVLCLLVRLLFG